MRYPIGQPPFQWQGEINTESNQINGLVAWWTNSGQSCQSFAEQMKKARLNSTLTNGAAIIASPFGHAVNFDGSNDYGTIASDSILNQSYLSFGCWIYNRETSGATKVIAMKPYTSHVSPYYQYGWYISVTTFVFNAVISGTIRQIVPSRQAPTGTWTHCMATYDGTTIRTYVNGIADSTGAYAGTINSYSTPISLGAHHWLAKNSTYCFNGMIHDLRLYNRALSPGEVWQLYDPQTRWELYAMPSTRTWFVPSSFKPYFARSTYMIGVNHHA